jgi:uncharacterized protein with HEPN domain
MWRDATWLLDMLLAGRKALDYAKGLTRDGFMESGLHQDAIVRQLAIVGEASKRVSGEFRDAHPEIPWKRIAGFRDVVIHDYFRVNLQEVWRILQTDLPALVAALEPLVPPDDAER